MKLKIKESEEKFNEIELEKGIIHGVNLIINGEMVACFDEDGRFNFYGKSLKRRYSGRWDK